MIYDLLFTFSENHKTELFGFCSKKDDEGKVARWLQLHSNMRSLYFVIKSIAL